MGAMITVAGEALIDIVVERDGRMTARPGGAPFNVTRALAALGCDCTFLGVLSGDLFGERLRASLTKAGVALAIPTASDAPTTLAIAQLDDRGAAAYTFYLDGTSAAMLRDADVPAGLLERSGAVVLGGLSLVIEPAGSTLQRAIPRIAAGALVLLDPNCRPAAIGDLVRFRARIADIVRRVDVLKLSVEDVRLLAGENDVRRAPRRLLGEGPRAVIVTDGPAPVSVLCAAGERTVSVPEVAVLDTIGAGDAFLAGFLAWWHGRGLGRDDVLQLDLLAGAAAVAAEVASAGCTVSGAGLPPGLSWD